MTAIKGRARRRGIGTDDLSQNALLNPFRDFKGGGVELFFARLFYYIRQYSRQFFLGLFVSLIGLIGTISYLAWSDAREERSLISFQKLMKEPTMDLESGAPEIAIEKLQEYARQFSHNSARIRATVYQQQYLDKTKKFKEAGLLSSRIADEIETPELKAYFYLRGALYLENVAENQAAERSYRLAAAAILKKDTFKARALFGQGRMLIALNKKNEARKVLEEILSFEKAQAHKLFGPVTLYLLELGR